MRARRRKGERGWFSPFGQHSKTSQIGWLINNINSFLMVLEAGKARIKEELVGSGLWGLAGWVVEGGLVLCPHVVSKEVPLVLLL